MNLKEQQYIVTLAGCGSMTQAAKKLNITQPALSSYLAGVENILGYPLFERTGKALRPTYLGELYLEKARKILALGEEFQQQREQVLHGYQGRIRVGIPIRRSPHLIPSALKIFRSRFPNVEVVVQEGNQRAMTEMLREDQLDLMLCNLVNQEGELEYEHLCWDPVIFLVQSAHPCCRYARYRDTFYHPWIDLREFEQEIFILQHQGQSLRQYSDQLLEEAGLSPQRITQIRNIETAAQMAANGLGVSFCLESYFRHMMFIQPPYRFSVGERQLAADFSAAYRRGRQLPEYTVQFIHLLKNLMEMEVGRMVEMDKSVNKNL